MLCDDCEGFLTGNYESYGIQVLRTKKNVLAHKEYISIKDINYQKYYLFLLSILWRVSVSNLEFYNTVSNLGGAGDLMRYSILNNTLKVSERERIRIDQIVKVCIFRIIDTSGFLSDEYIKKTMSNFAQEVDEKNKKISWYLIIEGFLIVYTILIGNDIHEHRFTRFFRNFQAQEFRGF